MGRDKDSSQGKGSRRQRLVARTVFGATVAVLLAVAGLPLGLSLAGAAPTIQIINPHAGTNAIASDRDQLYHLNTWVNVAPPQPLVEFELDKYTGTVPGQETFSETITIGNAVQDGPNAFSLLWDIPTDVADSDDTPGSVVSYKLRAILYTGFTTPGTGVEVGRDETDVTITHEGTTGASNVQITYPLNGGPAGVYIKPDGSGGNVIIEGDLSNNVVGSIQGYYTVTPVGDEPTWKTCGTGNAVTAPAPDNSKSVQVKCSTAAGDYALDITGVALRPQYAGTVQNMPGAADAHQVEPYFQRVESFTIDPPQTGGLADGACPKVIVTTADQQGRPIAGVNVDVHAQGPSDQTKFQTNLGDNAPPANGATKPPDKAHGSPEAAKTCSGDTEGGNGGQQGDHNVAGGADTKHVESVGGTDPTGRFRFGLTTDKEGVTQITAFADEDDDDEFCADEKSVDASLGWGQPAPSPTGLPTDKDSCPFATPSATPTPTASPSGSASASSSGSPSSSPAPPTHDRDITIEFEHGSLIVSGRVTVPDGTNKCRANVPVKIKRKTNGKFKTKRTVTTNGGGFYSTTLKDKPGLYKAVAPKATVDEDICLKTSATRRHSH